MGSKNQKQTTENKPPAWSVPLFEQSASEAQRIYDSGSGGSVYQGQTVAGLSPTTQGGIAGINAAAQNANTGANTYGTYGDIANRAGQMGNNLSGQIAGIGSGAQGISTEMDYRNVLSQTQNPTASERNLGGMASGSYLQNGNPYFTEMLNNQMDKAAAKIQSQFSGSGRFGSGANTNVLADTLGGLSTNALYNQFNQDTQNMLAANNMIDSSANARIGQQLSAVGGITGVQGQNIGNQLSATGMQGNLLQNALSTQMGATQAQSGLDQQNFANQLAAAQSQIDAGKVQDANTQAQLSADFAKWQSEDMQDWTRLGLLQRAAAGSAGNYGTSAQTVSQPFNAAQAIGALGSIFTKSDVRAKVDIVPVGRENGFTVYEFSYRGAKGRWRGVMAQDVIEKDPLAVSFDCADGLFAVDYGRIGIEPKRVA